MATYDYDEVVAASKEYFGGDSLAAEVFANKYALQNEQGEYLEKTPDDMHRRLAREFARIEAKYSNPMSEEEIYELFKEFKYVIPQGSPMSAIGNPYKVQSLSNCFVLETPYDSYGGILKTDQELAQIAKRRGGIGFSISSIRPRGMPTKNAAGTTDGIGIFMERFSNTCREVAQNGRRGALLISINCHHPEIRTFINIKKNRTKVTGANISIQWTDEFLGAVENNKQVELRWPVDSQNPEISGMVDAKEIWDEFIEASWSSGEPGNLYWDTALKNTPSDIYADEGYSSTSTNPCLTYDVKVAVADGRGAVPIGELAKEGKDVPVYSLGEDGKVCIKIMRNPRLTGKQKDVYEVEVEGGHTFKATQNHKIMVNGQGYVQIKDLKEGDSLHMGSRYQNYLVRGKKERKKDYIFLKNSNMTQPLSEHRVIWEFVNGNPVPNNCVIHHKDYNSQNNEPDNLECMDVKAHIKLHADRMKGENNPIHKIKKDPAKWKKYIGLQSEINTGEGNGNFSGFTHEELLFHAVKLTQEIGRRFSVKEWQDYAKPKRLPQAFSEWRKKEIGSILDMSRWAAKECGFEYLEEDPRVVSTLRSMIEQGYDANIKDGRVFVKKKCEKCGQEFDVRHGHREHAFCSIKCTAQHLNCDEDIKDVRRVKIREYQEEISKKKKTKQLDIYTRLKFDLGRKPKMKEWEEACKQSGVPHRVGKTLKYCFSSFKELAAEAENYNHRVVSIKYVGQEDVFNGTVDDTHNFYFGMFDEYGEDGRLKSLFFNNKNCGEIILSPEDSCRLLLLNSSTYVDHPFTDEAKFNYELFAEHVIRAQRLMDDVVDLEIEAVDKIIDKIKNDPEPDDVKKIELDLWFKIKDRAEKGRRTGLGLTAIGDMIASLNIKYGSSESIKQVEEVYKCLGVNAYYSSSILAQERGAFPIHNHKKEEGHPFLEQIWAEKPEIKALSKKYGRRNIALTTTAPCGSVSILTQTSSGIEPVFMLSYKRRRKINPSDKNVKVDFVDDVGDSWQEYTVYHHGVKKWMDITGEEDIEKSPYWNATANEIDWEAGVDLQAAAQSWLCHAVSKTTNLPNSATIEDVNKVYMRGWKTGCKGLTVYRDGCRSGVLVSEKDDGKDKSVLEDRPSQIIPSHAPKRPSELPCEIHHAQIRGVRWTILIGILLDTPYEIFVGHAEDLSLPNKCDRGKIVKQKKGHYNLHVDVGDDELIVKNISKTFANPESAWATRMVSAGLRHGIPCEFLVQTLSSTGNMTDMNKVIARLLKKFIKDGQKVRVSHTCERCGSDDLAYQEGCMSCNSCGSSKCS